MACANCCIAVLTLLTGAMSNSQCNTDNNGKPECRNADLYADPTSLLQRQVKVAMEGDSDTIGSFATVPIKWVIITKNDGTGNMSNQRIADSMLALNKYYTGGDPADVTEDLVKKVNALPATPGNCGTKCDIHKCVNSSFSPNVSITGCFCNTIDCSTWSQYGSLQGPRANIGITFRLESIKYIANDTWHDQCCCAHAAGLGYKDKQVEIIDSVVDKNEVRKSVTVIVCNMKTTLGMANILGRNGSCAGGPYVMLDKTFPDMTLAHEFGHFFGLYHTFDDYCPSGDKWGTCPKGIDVCDASKNLGDRIADTPMHRKQGSCSVGKDSCPNSPGLDPLDNMMSYSMCILRRFSPGQKNKVRDTVTKYFPDFLSQGGSSKTPADFPCDPEFPSNYKKGYNFKKAGSSSGGGAPPPADTGCQALLKQANMTCATDMAPNGCNCVDATVCCSGFACGGMAGQKMCLGCSWGYGWTKDSPAKCALDR